MKKLILIVLSIACTSLQAQEFKILKSKITGVTVFLSGAQVTEEAQVTLDKGENVLRLAGLAQNIDPRSIQAAAPEIVLINSVSHEVNYLKEQEKSPRVLALEDSLRMIQEKLEVLANEKAVLGLEQAMLLENQRLAGEAKGITAEDLRKSADFFRQRGHDISERQLKNKRLTEKQTEERNRINQQLQELNYQRNKPSNDIVIKVKTDHPRTVRLLVRYLVNDAGWVPAYDLRCKDTDSPIQIDYRADVWQNTGVNWENIALTLSTGDPRQGGTKPELAQWNLRFSSPGYAVTRGIAGFYEQGVESRTTATEKSREISGKREERSKTLADYTQMRNTATTAEFSISVPQDVPSNGKMQQVSVQSAKLPALFEHYAVPKLDKDAFLVARITGWESLNLMPGQVNIFFEGTYVTQAYLDPTFTTDTLDFSLGRDKKLIIQREMLKDFNSRKTIGTTRERTFGYEYTIRNTKSNVVRLKLIDQVPVSQDQEIIVKEIELSGANKEEATGLLSWNIELKPAETKKLKLVFSVKHPKKKTVPGI